MSAKLQKIFPHLLAALSGLLLALAYPPYDVLGLIWIGLLPLFFVLFVPKSSDKNTDLGPRHALGIGMIFGLIYFGITYLPLLHTYPLGWAGITSPAIGLSLVFGIWALITFLGALPYSLLVLTTLFIKKRLTADRAIAIFPFLWVIFEYLRAYFISIALYGKGALLGAHWTNGHLGYALHDNSILLQSADLWGVYGLSLLVVAINAAVFYIGLSYVLHRRVLWSKILIPFLILLVALAYGAWRIKNIEQATAATKSVNVALIQTDFQPNYIAGDEYLRAVQSTIAALVNEAIKNNSEIIVLPEGSQFLPTTAASTLAAAQKPFILIDNAAIKTANGLTNSTLYFDSEQKLVAVSEKMLLVFFGEYLPYIFKIPAKLAGAGELVASFEARRNRVPGAEIKILRTAFGNIGVMICSEPLSPSIVRSLSAILTPDNQLISANMLFNINSEALFHGSRAYTAQNRAVLQMRAVENRRPIAQATNAGASFAVAAAGAIAEQASDTAKNTIIYAQIKPSDTLSFYTIFGDWIVLASAIVLICAAILIHKRRAK